jgi:hypothetical protein
MNKSENIQDLAKALCAVQSKIKGAQKDSKNPFFDSKYADLQSVWDSCRELLGANGLSIAQTFEPCENGVVVTTTLLHSSGQWLSGSLRLPAVKQDPQAYGSAITYGRRYALAAMIGIYQTDDDAEGSMIREPKPESKNTPAKQPGKPAAPKLNIKENIPDFSSNPGDYVMKRGKFTGRVLKDLTEAELKEHKKFVESMKNLTGDWAESLVMVKAFLGEK